MSSEITSTVWGIAPRSESPPGVSSAIDSEGVEPGDHSKHLERRFSNQQVEDFKVLVGVLTAAGIDYSAVRWGGSEDYFHEIVEGAGGFREVTDEEPLTHWPDTDMLSYRQPIIEGFRTKPDNWPSLIPAEYHLPMISPYAFARMAKRGVGVSEYRALKRTKGEYDEILDKATSQRARGVLFHEPYAASHQVDKSERLKLRQTIGELAANHPKLAIGIYFSFGNAAELVSDFAEDERLAAIGCDLLRTPIRSLPELPGHRFLAGLVDGASTRMQDDQEIKNNLEATREKTKAPEISLTHSNELKLVPLPTAFEKILQLGRVAEIARSLWAVENER